MLLQLAALVVLHVVTIEATAWATWDLSTNAAQPTNGWGNGPNDQLSVTGNVPVFTWNYDNTCFFITSPVTALSCKYATGRAGTLSITMTGMPFSLQSFAMSMTNEIKSQSNTITLATDWHNGGFPGSGADDNVAGQDSDSFTTSDNSPTFELIPHVPNNYMSNVVSSLALVFTFANPPAGSSSNFIQSLALSFLDSCYIPPSTVPLWGFYYVQVTCYQAMPNCDTVETPYIASRPTTANLAKLQCYSGWTVGGTMPSCSSSAVLTPGTPTCTDPITPIYAGFPFRANMNVQSLGSLTTFFSALPTATCASCLVGGASFGDRSSFGSGSLVLSCTSSDTLVISLPTLNNDLYIKNIGFRYGTSYIDEHLTTTIKITPNLKKGTTTIVSGGSGFNIPNSNSLYHTELSTFTFTDTKLSASSTDYTFNLVFAITGGGSGRLIIRDLVILFYSYCNTAAPTATLPFVNTGTLPVAHNSYYTQSCTDGYTASGHGFQCLDGVFQTSDVTCIAAVCDLASYTVSPLVLDTTTTGPTASDSTCSSTPHSIAIGKQCTVICDTSKGYVASSTTLVCSQPSAGASATFGAVPQCTLSTCSISGTTLYDSTTMTVSPSSCTSGPQNYNMQCTVTCITNYNGGSSMRTCGKNTLTVWDPTLITCTPVNKCLTNNGGCDATNGLCTPTGPNQAHCQCAPGWTGDGVTCTASSCDFSGYVSPATPGVVVDTSNSSPSCSPNPSAVAEGGQCSLKCDATNFYVPTGTGTASPSTVSCSSIAVKSGSSPSCILTCPIDSTLYDSTKDQYSCPAGSVTTVKQGQSCTVSCSNTLGWDGTTPVTRNCIANRQWDGANPVCTVLQCNSNNADLLDLSSMTSPCTSKQTQDYLTSCDVFCDNDHTGTKTTRVCQNTKQWSSTVPTCIAKCAEVTVQNSLYDYHCDELAQNAQCEVSCVNGYKNGAPLSINTSIRGAQIPTTSNMITCPSVAWDASTAICTLCSDTHCAQCTPGDTSCNACMSGYDFNKKGVCDNTPCGWDHGTGDEFNTGCDSVANKGTCTLSCLAGYFVTGDTDNSITLTCSHGEFDSTPTCTQCDAGCATCVVSGSCVTCLHGYQFASATDRRCVDINECSTNNGGCSLQYDCSNTAGSFSCFCSPNGCPVACSIEEFRSSLAFKSPTTPIRLQPFRAFPSSVPVIAQYVPATNKGAFAQVYDFMVDVWVKFSPTGSSYSGMGGPILSGLPGATFYFYLYVDPANGFATFAYCADSCETEADNRNLLDGKWHHILVSYSTFTSAKFAATIIFFVDGVAGTAINSGGGFFTFWPGPKTTFADIGVSSDTVLLLGSYCPGVTPTLSTCSYFQGDMSHLRIWLGSYTFGLAVATSSAAFNTFFNLMLFDICNRYAQTYSSASNGLGFWQLMSVPMHDFEINNPSLDDTKLDQAPSFSIYGTLPAFSTFVSSTPVPQSNGYSYDYHVSAGVNVCKSAALECAARGLRLCSDKGTTNELSGLLGTAYIAPGQQTVKTVPFYPYHLLSGGVDTDGVDDFCQQATSRSYRCCGPFLATSYWGDWKPCTASCGGGTQTRTCNLGSPLNRDCDGASTRQCATTPCDPPLTKSPTAFEECSETCNGGFLALTCGKSSADDWTHCNSGTTAPCNMQSCADEYYFGDYGDCSASCTTTGSASPVRKRDCLLNGGTVDDSNCHGLGPATISCNTQFCPVNGTWQDWQACNASCGGGMQIRDCNPPQNGGWDCYGPRLQLCNTDPCNVIGNWTAWTSCSQPCGGGNQTRFCSVVYPSPPTEDNFCKDDLEGGAVRACNTQNCSVNGQWGGWGNCSVQCGPGGIRTRLCDNPPPQYGGTDCFGQSWDFCQFNTSCPVDGNWTDFGPCNVACGGGFQTRNCTKPTPYMGGKFCEGSPSQPCNEFPCPVNGGWSAWGPCSHDCAPGNATVDVTDVTVMNRTRFCTNPPPQFNGSYCPDSAVMPCYNVSACVVGSGFGPYGACNQPCGGGVQVRFCSGGEVTDECKKQDPVTGGITVRPCNTIPCNSYGNWSAWSACSADCGTTGVQTRICHPGAVAALGCVSGGSSQKCNQFSCDFDGYWGDWGECSVDFCGGGIETRPCLGRRGNGAPCPDNAAHVNSTRPCNTDPCPADICTIPDVCFNNGTCIDVQAWGSTWRFLCECRPFTFGARCNSTILPCDTNPCDNGATCTTLNSTAYRCDCPIGYLGDSCHTVIRDIRNLPPIGFSTPPPKSDLDKLQDISVSVEARVKKLEVNGLNTQWWTGGLDEGLGEDDLNRLNRIVVAWREGQEDSPNLLRQHTDETSQTISRVAKQLNPKLNPQNLLIPIEKPPG